jgi:hypothetical protein
MPGCALQPTLIYGHFDGGLAKLYVTPQFLTDVASPNRPGTGLLEPLPESIPSAEDSAEGERRFRRDADHD